MTTDVYTAGYQTLRLTFDDGVGVLTLDRPERRNGLTEEMYDELIDCFQRLRHDRATRVLVVTGAGEAFCVGADLGRQDGIRAAPMTRMRDHADAPLALHRLPFPTIAAVNGIAAGGGCNLALGCDLVLAADTARFTEVFVRRALGLDWGGSWLLPRLVGIQRAKQLAFFGDVVPAQEAERIGLVNEIVPAAELLPTALGWARRLADGPPLALALIKEELNASIGPPMVSALEHEATGQATSAASEDVAEGIASFLEKRPPRFVGR